MAHSPLPSRAKLEHEGKDSYTRYVSLQRSPVLPPSSSSSPLSLESLSSLERLVIQRHVRSSVLIVPQSSTTRTPKLSWSLSPSNIQQHHHGSKDRRIDDDIGNANINEWPQDRWSSRRTESQLCRGFQWSRPPTYFDCDYPMTVASR
jgi:hypothetical protein